MRLSTRLRPGELRRLLRSLRLVFCPLFFALSVRLVAARARVEFVRRAPDGSTRRARRRRLGRVDRYFDRIVAQSVLLVVVVILETRLGSGC